MAVLPYELLSHVVQYLRPIGSPVAIPASHASTKALLSLTLVSSTLHCLALPYLYNHCLYIDSPVRLKLLLRTLSKYGQTVRRKRMSDGRVSRRLVGPYTFDLKPIVLRSLYLAPFTGVTIDELPVANMIASLFELLSPSLTRLVIDMPLRSVCLNKDVHNIPALLRQAFRRLTALEEFTSARDALHLDEGTVPLHSSIQKPLIWSLWPRLTRLALYELNIHSPALEKSISKIQSLEVIVLTRDDGDQRILASGLARVLPLKRVLLVNNMPGYPMDEDSESMLEALIKPYPHHDEAADVVRINVALPKKPIIR